MNTSPQPTIQASKRALSVLEFAHAVGIGRTMVFAEIKAGRLIAKKVGSRTIVPIEEMERWLKSLTSAGDVLASER